MYCFQREYVSSVLLVRLPSRGELPVNVLFLASKTDAARDRQEGDIGAGPRDNATDAPPGCPLRARHGDAPAPTPRHGVVFGARSQWAWSPCDPSHRR